MSLQRWRVRTHPDKWKQPGLWLTAQRQLVNLKEWSAGYCSGLLCFHAPLLLPWVFSQICLCTYISAVNSSGIMECVSGLLRTTCMTACTTPYPISPKHRIPGAPQGTAISKSPSKCQVSVLCPSYKRHCQPWNTTHSVWTRILQIEGNNILKMRTKSIYPQLANCWSWNHDSEGSEKMGQSRTDFALVFPSFSGRVGIQDQQMMQRDQNTCITWVAYFRHSAWMN